MIRFGVQVLTTGVGVGMTLGCLTIGVGAGMIHFGVLVFGEIDSGVMDIGDSIHIGIHTTIIGLGEALFGAVIAIGTIGVGIIDFTETKDLELVLPTILLEEDLHTIQDTV